MRQFSFLVISSIFLFACGDDSSGTSDTTGNWIKRSDYEGVARTEAVVFIIQDKAYVGSGFDGRDRLDDFWQYDADQNYWTQKADMPATPRNSAVAFSIDSKGYVGTGYDGNNKLKDFWEYDANTNQWKQIADFGGTARYGAVAFSLDGKGYVGTGFDGNHLKDFWEYNPATNQWVQRVSVGGSKRTDAVAFVLDNKAYVATGTNNGTLVNDLWQFDAATQTWTEKRKISNASDDSYDDDYNIVRSNSVAFLVGAKAYVALGEKGGLSGDVWEYDPASDTWNNINGFEGTARTGAVGFTLKGRGFVCTGRNSSFQFDDVWELKPADEKNSND
jgi:N-acetylneuraminic acid mutarotase